MDGRKASKEMKQLQKLRDSLEKSSTMTQQMLCLLDTFEGRLRKLEDTITPVYQETSNLQRRYENIEKTQSILTDVISHYHVVEEVDAVICDSHGHNLTKYLSAMERLQNALKYFNEHHPAGAEEASVRAHFDTGKATLEKEFRSILTRNSKPTSPIELLNIVDEGVPDEDIELQGITPKAHKDLTAIANWLVTSREQTDFMDVYSQIRSATIRNALLGLKDHAKSGSLDGSATSASASPVLTNKQRGKLGTPSKHLKKLDLVKKAMKQQMDAVRRQSVAGGVMGGGGGSPSQSEANLAEHEQAIGVYISCVSAMLALIKAESALMQGIIPDRHQRRVFDKLIQSALDLITTDGEAIGKQTNLVRNDHSAVLSVFPVLKHLRAVKPAFDKVLEVGLPTARSNRGGAGVLIPAVMAFTCMGLTSPGCQTPTRSKLPTLISHLDNTGAKALQAFVESLKSDPDKSMVMPTDGTVHEVTSNTILFLEQLFEYAETAGAMLLTQDPTSLPDVKTHEKPRMKLAEFITKVVSALTQNLNLRSMNYDSTLKAIFLLNNYNYILKSLKRTGLLDLVHIWNNEIEKLLAEQITEQKRLYSRSWSRVIHHISDASKGPTLSPDGKLKDKDKQAIKDKFSGFNKELEEMVRVQRGYSIPDTDLRDNMRKDNRDYVLPQYKHFLLKYMKITFTKNPDKYIRYSEVEVGRTIDLFFEGRTA